MDLWARRPGHDLKLLLHEVTRGYTGLYGVVRGYMGISGDIWGNKGLYPTWDS